MLKLSVRFGDRVYLTTGAGELVEILVQDDGRGRMALGFAAPQSVKIEREIIYVRRTSAPVGDDNGPAETR